MSDRKWRILLVDDEPSILKIVGKRLQVEGYDVVVAADGQEAMEKTKEVHPDLIVLDLMLPKIDGYKVCRTLKFDERYRNLPILILSARSGEQDRQLALSMGADAFVTKPYDMRDLVTRIRARLGVVRREAA